MAIVQLRSSDLLRILRDFLRPYRRSLLIVFILQLAQTITALGLPTLNADIIDEMLIGRDAGYVLRIGGVMLAVTLIQIICSTGAAYLGARTAMMFGRDVRAAVFTRVQDISAREVAHFGIPSLITRTTNDVQQVQALAATIFTVMASTPLMCLGGILMALNQDVSLASVLLVSVPTLGIVVSLILIRMRALFRLMQQRLDMINRILREQISGARVIRAFVRDRTEQERFSEANVELLDVSVGVGRLMALMSSPSLMLLNASSVAILWFGGRRVENGALRIGALTAFNGYLGLIFLSIMMTTGVFMLVPRAEVCAERIAEVLDIESSVAPVTGHAQTMVVRGHLELRNIEFRYPGATDPVLHRISLVARPGEITAVIGSTGSGKTTLLNLVPRLVDATGGEVLVDGIDIRELAPGTLSGAIGYVPQKAYLFTGTVASNLRYGKTESTDAELWHALEIAQARDFVEKMPGGLDAPIAQGGTNLSGGQRQRVAIARALVRRPMIYLFDDAFSALDYATDTALRKALAHETADATVVIVAQRASTIRDADHIAVLDKGRLVATGRHQELMDTDETYREIVLSQLAEDEVAVSGPMRGDSKEPFS
jgi:ATP-binding cassette subfamily B multidrug efflux pump